MPCAARCDPGSVSRLWFWYCFLFAATEEQRYEGQGSKSTKPNEGSAACWQRSCLEDTIKHSNRCRRFTWPCHSKKVHRENLQSGTGPRSSYGATLFRRSTARINFVNNFWRKSNALGNFGIQFA